ncbi:hypothetical protein PL321_07775 [Caloramator sp. mosi_1]|uniref:hypothetical protein n=1 Tax=Caloramator sp. mosi_1 TaxID=3023090 RepID=UPI00236038AB|nr:hypothetical protein [Caloramator sp. mosi_1]WDC85325.1 hypothetical protein PL321_07775 [Caloramator sp. mosi_1]
MNNFKLIVFMIILSLFNTIVFLINQKYLIGFIWLVSLILYLISLIKFHKHKNIKPLTEEELQILNSELKELILQNKKYDAIKKYRKTTNAGLKEAYEYIEKVIINNQ